MDRSEQDARSFEEKFEDLKKTVERHGSRRHPAGDEEARIPEVQGHGVDGSAIRRIVQAIECKCWTGDSANFSVEKGASGGHRMKEVCKLDAYDLKFFLGNLFHIQRAS